MSYERTLGHAVRVDEQADPARIPDDVRPLNLSSVGNYGLKIRWSDGHDTGIYSYDRLRELGQDAP